MKILILGANGMLGHKLFQRLSTEHQVTGTVRRDAADLSRNEIFQDGTLIGNVDAFVPESFRTAINSLRPDVVVNAIGIIKQVPAAKDVPTSLTVNSILPHRVAAFATEVGARFITISTDCVFSGRRGGYSESDQPDSEDLYGLSKRLGEVDGPNCLTLRTSMIGREIMSSHSIVEWFLARSGGSVKGFVNALYTGLTTLALSDTIAHLVNHHPSLSGIWHVASDPISKHDLLCLLNDEFNAGVSITPDEAVVIDRTLDSTRFREWTGLIPPSWQEMVEAMAKDKTPYDLWRREVSASVP